MLSCKGSETGMKGLLVSQGLRLAGGMEGSAGC